MAVRVFWGKDIMDKYHDQERELSEYRDKCKNEALELFSKWFWHLWD